MTGWSIGGLNEPRRRPASSCSGPAPTKPARARSWAGATPRAAGAGAGGDAGPGRQPAHGPPHRGEARPPLRRRRSAAGAGRPAGAHLPGHAAATWARWPRRWSLAPEAWSPAAGQVQDALRVRGLDPGARPASRPTTLRELAPVHERAGPEAVQRPVAEGLAGGGRGLVRARRGDQAHGLGEDLAAKRRTGATPGRWPSDALGARLTPAGRQGHRAGRDPRGGPGHPADELRSSNADDRTHPRLLSPPPSSGRRAGARRHRRVPGPQGASPPRTARAQTASWWWSSAAAAWTGSRSRRRWAIPTTRRCAARSPSPASASPAAR